MKNTTSSNRDVPTADGIAFSIVDPKEDSRDTDGSKPDVRTPEGRREALRIMATIANDPRVSDQTRERADRLLKNVSMIHRGPIRRKRVKLPKLSPYVGPLIAATLWSSLFAIRAFLASARMEQCWDELSGVQMDICVRNAIEGRDEAIMLALAGPILVTIALILYKQVRNLLARQRL